MLFAYIPYITTILITLAVVGLICELKAPKIVNDGDVVYLI